MQVIARILSGDIMIKVLPLVVIAFISHISLAQTANQLKLFTEIMPIWDIINFSEAAKKSFEVHSLDSYSQFPPLRDVQTNKLKIFSGARKIKGTMKYVKAFPMIYNYDVIHQGAEYIHEVRIYFIGATPADKILFENLISQAEQIWNAAKIYRDFKYSFRFKRTDDPWSAHYHVTIQNSTRGPYNITWGRNWNGISVAHEMGHMMGIADEYETITSESFCLPQSLMCSSWQGQLMKHHYYFILRRLVN